MKKTKQILSILLLICILFSNLQPVLAKSLSQSEKVNLVFDHNCTSVLKIKGQDLLKGVAYVYYKDPDTNIKYPAFCVQPEKEGVGTGAGDNYDVTVSQLNNPILWRMLYKGYVGSTYQSWGLECDDDLYFATKTAVHCFADGSTPTTKYEVPNRVGWGENVSLEEVQRRGAAVLNVAQQIYDYAYSSADNYIKATVSVNPSGNLTEQTIGGTKYLVQSYSVTANKELSSYEVSILDFPAGTRILNSDNIDSTKMTNSTTKIAIPLSNISENFTGYINITEAKVKSFPIFYGDSGNADTQNYVFIDPSEVTTARATLNFNVNKSSIKIVKTDSENSNPLEGVTFNVKYSDGTNIGDFTTDSSGSFTVNNLKPGKIVITEKSTSNKYILDPTPKEVTLSYGENKTVRITNDHKKGNLVIRKVDAEDNTIVLENVTFKVYDENNKLIDTVHTDSSGIARVDNINTGTYKIVETETNQFYRLNTEEHTLNIKPSSEGGDSEIVIENEAKKGYIEIHKYDKEALEKYSKNLGVSGVVFGIFDEKGNKIQEMTTDSNGYAKSGELRLDKKYIVKELKTRDEYIKNDTEWKVDLIKDGIVDGYVYTLNITNEHKKGNLFIEKITKDDHTIQMGNVEFELYLVGNGEIKLYIGTYYTDANGELFIENLNTGNYMLKETSTNRWYYLKDDTKIEVKWYEEYGNTNVTIENEKKKGIIRIIKRDNDFNEYPLENIKFNVYDEDDNFIETITTNSEGIAESSRLRIDKKYYVVETETLQNYILDDTVHNINFIEGLTKDEIADIQTDTIYTLELKNRHKKGNLLVSKVDADNNSIPLENVTFELYAKNVDKPYQENQLIGTYKTNSEGKILIDNLWTGEYYLKETETNIWYKLNTDNQPVEIKHNETSELIIQNEIKKGYITIDKYDSEFNNIKIPQVVFNIYDEDANFIESITTDETGFASSSLLPINKVYYVVEVKTNDFYILTNEFFKVNFTENMTETDIANIQVDLKYSLAIKNDVKRGNLQVLKVDKDNNTIPIEGVKFDLIDDTTNNVITTLITNENGIATAENLRIDRTYTLVEKETNYKYKLNQEPITNIQIPANETNVLHIENEKIKGKLKVIKVDSENHSVLIPNVEFQILDSMGNVIETLVTDENGEAVSSDLPCVDETYYLKESKNADIYELSDKVIEVELTADEITNIVFEDDAKRSSLEVIKVDKDNKEYRIPDVTFEVFDETTNEVVGTMTTDENGVATIDNLKVTHTYSVKETISNYKYKLNEQVVTNIVLTPDEITSINFENEKLKGKMKVIKVDKDNVEYKISGVTFEILDSKGNVVETLVTDENGEAVSSDLPCVDETYYLRETITQDTYVLSDEVKEVVLTADEITNIVFENEKIKGKLQITKIDSNNSEKKLKDAVFGIFDENNNLVQEITTDENGIAISDDLIIGKYYCKELNSGSEYYLLNENTYEFEIKTNGEIVEKTVDNEPVDIEVTVNKTGSTEIKPGEKVFYAFSNVGNASNIYLENFKWFDYIPTDYIRLETMSTGTWNQDLTYDVYYKTNKSDKYILFKEDLSTNTNYDLDFTKIQLAEDEYIVETMFDFGKVDVGFKNSISPTMQCKSLDNLNDGQKFTNITKTVGIYFDLTAESDSEHTTIVHKPKEENEPVLPRTGK